MTTITIPKNIISNSNLIAIPYDEYERFLASSFIKKEVVLSLSQKNRLKIARKNLSNGKFLTPNELKKKNWKLKIDPGVYKDLSKFPKDYADKILYTVLSLADSPYAGDIEKIKGEENLWRRRIGRYRIFYEIYPEFHFVHVLWTERRGSNTY